MNENPDRTFYNLNIDAGAMWARRVIDRMVAIKTVIIPETLPDETRETFVQRFLQEARAAARRVLEG